MTSDQAVLQYRLLPTTNYVLTTKTFKRATWQWQLMSGVKYGKWTLSSEDTLFACYGLAGVIDESSFPRTDMRYLRRQYACLSRSQDPSNSIQVAVIHHYSSVDDYVTARGYVSQDTIVQEGTADTLVVVCGVRCESTERLLDRLLSKVGFTTSSFIPTKYKNLLHSTITDVSPADAMNALRAERLKAVVRRTSRRRA